MRTRTIFLILTFLCLAVYANSFRASLIADDYVYFRLIRNFSAQRLFFQHCLVVSVHIATTFLVFLFLRTFFGSLHSAIGSAIFAVHPIHIEAITWLTGLRYAYGAFFILAAYLLYENAIRERFKVQFYVMSFFIYSFCMLINFNGFFYLLEKNTALLPAPNFVFYLGFPFLLMLSDWYFKRFKQNWRLWLLFFIPVVISLCLSHKVIDERLVWLSQVSHNSPISLRLFFMRVFYCLGVFWGILTWPAQLAFYHEPVRIYLDKILFFVSGVFFFFAWILPRFYILRRALFLLGFWFIFSWPCFSPVEICPLISEKYFYLASVCFCMAVCLILERISLKNALVSFIIGLILIGGYSIRTITRNADYYDNLKFWRKEVRIVPRSFKSWNNLGTAFVLKGQYLPGIIAYKRASILNPEYELAKVNIMGVKKILLELIKSSKRNVYQLHRNASTQEAH